VLALVSTLLALTACATRPARLYSERLGVGLGFVGRPQEAPVQVVRHWSYGYLAPLTPAGLVSLLEPLDVLVGLSLLTAAVLLTTALVARRRGRPEGTAGQAAFGRFRVRTALLGVAVIGIYLGWELESWRSWRLSRGFLGRARHYAESEALYTKNVGQIKAELGSLAPSPAPMPGDTRTAEARAAARAFRREHLRRQLAFAEAMVSVLTPLKDKYTHAARHPRAPVSPDPRLPDHAARLWPFVPRGPGQAASLEAFTEQVRLYPCYAPAHEGRAWILATAPDPGLRDGEAAVASATRACELTQWEDPNALKALAAACAAAGDFARAVRWQERAIERFAATRPEGTFKQDARQWLDDCLKLYKSGKAYRGPRSFHL
jgi:hypothetical protein